MPGERECAEEQAVRGALSSQGTRQSWIARVFWFYVNGFRHMTWGRTLWLIILIKLFIIFAILRIFFFPNFLGSRFDSDEAKSDYVLQELTGVRE
jgi:hypothetical protein